MLFYKFKLNKSMELIIITLIILFCFYFLLGVSILYRIQSLLHKDIYLQYNDLFKIVKDYTQLEIIILWPIILYNYYNNAI